MPESPLSRYPLNEYQRYVIEEFADEYHERHLSRRELLRRVLLVTGSIPLSASVLLTLGCGDDDETPSESAAPTTAGPTAAAIGTTAGGPTAGAQASPAAAEAAAVKFAGPASDLIGYLSRPSGPGPFPAVLVIHENRGLNDHTRDVARRFAGAGFVALAVDLVSRNGGSAADSAQNTAFLSRSTPDDLVADLRAYTAYVGGLTGVRRGAIGVVGFCFGGGYTWEAAAAIPEIRAAVPFYGTCRVIDQLKTTKAAVLAIYGERDTRITSQAETVRAALAASGRPFDIQIYPGANHAFFNDTGANFNAAAAEDAWKRTLAWFGEHLKA